MPNTVMAIVQNAAAILRNACKPRLNMRTRIAARTAIEIKATAIFQPGRFPHDMLKTETTWAHDHTQMASMVRKNHVIPCRMSCSNWWTA